MENKTPIQNLENFLPQNLKNVNLSKRIVDYYLFGLSFDQIFELVKKDFRSVENKSDAFSSMYLMISECVDNYLSETQSELSEERERLRSAFESNISSFGSTNPSKALLIEGLIKLFYLGYTNQTEIFNLLKDNFLSIYKGDENKLMNAIHYHYPIFNNHLKTLPPAVRESVMQKRKEHPTPIQQKYQACILEISQKFSKSSIEDKDPYDVLNNIISFVAGKCNFTSDAVKRKIRETTDPSYSIIKDVLTKGKNNYTDFEVVAIGQAALSSKTPHTVFIQLPRYGNIMKRLEKLDPVTYHALKEMWKKNSETKTEIIFAKPISKR